MNMLLLVVFFTVCNSAINGAALNESDTEAALSFSGDHADTEHESEILVFDAEGHEDEETEISELASSGGFSLKEGSTSTFYLWLSLRKPKMKGNNQVLLRNVRMEKKKVKNLCETTYKYYCFRGVCMFLLSVNQVACRCYIGYEGARCAHMSISRAVIPEESNDVSSPSTLVIVAVVLSVISLIVTLIVVTVK
nr:PREDICTED: amphiregulin-like [Latimeria chalumnae]|eukprot:XP_014352133.1 PREDICTED: amphiregulin-like [Latimeria chalumnae]